MYISATDFLSQKVRFWSQCTAKKWVVHPPSKTTNTYLYIYIQVC